MTLFALLLVLAAAAVHASWNLILKKTGGGLALFWWVGALSTLFYAPFALAAYLWQRPDLGLWAWLAIGASAAIHAIYYLVLDRGYRHGDLSLVYPLARGTGPLLTLIGALALLGERPSMLAIGGALMIVTGVVFMLGNPLALHRRGALLSVAYALLTGLMIAGYTLVDKTAVSLLLVPPLVFDWLANLGRWLCYSLLAKHRGSDLAAAWRQHRRPIAAIALLSPLSYLLVLTAMRFTPVSYVAPAREVSILIATLFGAHLLREGEAARRLGAGALMVAGLAMLALG